MLKEGSLKARIRTVPRLSSNSALLAKAGLRMKGSTISTAMMATAKIRKTVCQG